MVVFQIRQKLAIKIFKFFILSVFFVCLAACGGSSSSTTSSGGGGSSGDDETGFQVTGQYSSSGTASINANTNFVLYQVTADDDEPTDIIAVSPETGNVTCKEVDLEDDGSFDFRLTSGRPWFFYFINRLRSGSNMFLGRFKTDTLDTLLPNSSTGSTNLGTITLDTDTGLATSDTDHDQIVEDLEIDSDTADSIGEIDDVARRYSNPDMDGDGEIDCGQSNHSFFLDFHVRFNMLNDGTNNVEVNDLLGSYYNESTMVTDYSSTGVYIAYPTDFSSAASGTVTFVDSSVTTEEAGAVTANTEISDITENAFTGYYGYGVNTTSSSELPSGTIVYAFGDKEITFSDVETPALSEITAPTGRVFPFVKFNKTDSTCTSSCTLSGLSYKWMKKTATGWEAATLEELGLIVADGDSTGSLGFRVGGDESKQVDFKFEKTSLEATIDWDSSGTQVNLTGVTDAEFEALTETDICHIGLSHDDKLGMRYFQNIDNSNDDCSS